MNIIRLTHKDMNEYVQKHAQELREKKDKVQAILNDINKIHSIKLKDIEVNFLLSVLEDVVPDDVSEAEMISNIKNILNDSTEFKNNEKR